MGTSAVERQTAKQKSEITSIKERLGEERFNIFFDKRVNDGINRKDRASAIGKLAASEFIKAGKEEVARLEAGQKRKVRERKQTIFAGGNVGDNIFRRTLGGL